MKVYDGKIAWIDLTKREIKFEESVKYNDYLGGRGVGAHIVFEEVPVDAHPLSPENVLTFNTGLLTGTLAPASARLSVCTKNVESHGYSFASTGSFFPLELKLTGIDHIIVKGKASSPVFLFIHDDKVEIREASHLWGMDSWETECAIKRELGDEKIRVGSIGQAGENLVAMACIIFDRNRAAGWGGCGAVMGSKNLKAIAVRGKGSIEIDHPEEFMDFMGDIWEKFDNSKTIELFRKYSNYGTSGGGGVFGLSPQSVKNMEDEYLDPAETAKIHPQVFKEKYEKRRLGCFGCPIYCSAFYEVKEGKHKGLKVEALKTNIYRALGSNLGISDRESILKANDLVDRYGMNCDSVSAVIAWAIEIYERGIIDSSDTDGLTLRWSDGDLLIELLGLIAHRKGFGAILADGVHQAAKFIGRGSEKYEMSVKKHGMCEQAIRMNKGWALGIMTASIAGGHLCGAPNTEQRGMSKEESEKFFGISTAGDGSSYEDKGKLVSWFEKYKILADLTGLCSFTTYWLDTGLLGPEDFAKMINLCVGTSLTGLELLEIGERVYNIEKAFNTLHADFGRADDMPPRKLTEVPVASGPHKGAVIDPVKWETMLDDYYVSHGWDRRTGLQTRKCLEDLNLPEVLERLQNAGKLVE